MRLVDLYWLVAPDFRTDGFGVSWMDFTAPIGLVGLWLAYFLTQLEKRPLMPLNDPHLEEALEHGTRISTRQIRHRATRRTDVNVWAVGKFGIAPGR